MDEFLPKSVTLLLIKLGFVALLVAIPANHFTNKAVQTKRLRIQSLTTSTQTYLIHAHQLISSELGEPMLNCEEKKFKIFLQENFAVQEAPKNQFAQFTDCRLPKTEESFDWWEFWLCYLLIFLSLSVLYAGLLVGVLVIEFVED